MTEPNDPIAKSDEGSVIAPDSASNTDRALRFIRYAAFGLVAVAFVAYFLFRGGQTETAPPATAGSQPASTAAVSPAPNTAEASALDRSLAFYQAERFEESIAAANEALQANPKSAQAYNNIGVAALRLRKWDAAESALKTALQLSPGYDLAQNNLAWLARERAAAAAPPPDPNSYEGLITRSKDSYLAGRYQEAIDAARAALKLKADSPEAYNNIAVSYSALKQWDEAITSAQRAIALKPDFQLAKNNLAWAQRGKAESGRK
jgi:tetratricopeptide (TPR) repeat protein